MINTFTYDTDKLYLFLLAFDFFEKMKKHFIDKYEVYLIIKDIRNKNEKDGRINIVEADKCTRSSENGEAQRAAFST